MTRTQSLSLPITSVAVANALGVGFEVPMERLRTGGSGLRPSDECVSELPLSTYVGALSSSQLTAPPPDLASYDSRVLRLLLSAFAHVESDTRKAVERWGGARVGLFLGTSTGGLDRTEVAFAHLARTGALATDFLLRSQHDFHAAAEVVAKIAKITGPTSVISTACSSSGKVFATAARWLRMGWIDAALVGGADALCRMTLQGFSGLGILSDKRCRPFASGRNGINIGEGAALLLLERASDAPLAYLRGVGESADAHNMSSPDPRGEGAKAAMLRALAQAGVAADAVDYINAHGTATQQNDLAESLAIRSVFGADMPWVASTKGYVGHLLGAAGATEAAFVVDALQRGVVPQSLGSEELDPACAIRVAQRPEITSVRFALSNSFAFGGSNVCVAFGSEPGV